MFELKKNWLTFNIWIVPHKLEQKSIFHVFVNRNKNTIFDDSIYNTYLSEKE